MGSECHRQEGGEGMHARLRAGSDRIPCAPDAGMVVCAGGQEQDKWTSGLIAAVPRFYRAAVTGFCQEEVRLLGGGNE